MTYRVLIALALAALVSAASCVAPAKMSDAKGGQSGRAAESASASNKMAAMKGM